MIMAGIPFMEEGNLIVSAIISLSIPLSRGEVTFQIFLKIAQINEQKSHILSDSMLHFRCNPQRLRIVRSLLWISRLIH